jgi:hypothetical protein
MKDLLQAVTAPLPDLGAGRRVCFYAKPFAAFCDKLVTDTRARLTDVTLNVAQLHLQATFWSWHKQAPPTCRRHLTGQDGILCLLQLYEEAWDKLHEMELNVLPPRLQPPAPIQVVDVPGVFAGEFPSEK